MAFNVLVYSDGRPEAEKALRLAADLARRTGAELAVITVRRGTPAGEAPAPVGEDLPPEAWPDLPEGLRRLLAAQEVLVGAGLLDAPAGIRIRPIPHGCLFVGSGPDGRRVPFYECFGHFLETLNLAVEERRYDLLVVAPPRGGSLGRWLRGDAARRLALNLHTSLLVVRGGGLDGRWVICADDSPSARRIFPLLRPLLPAMPHALEMVCVQRGAEAQEAGPLEGRCLRKAREWLESCGKEVRSHDLEGAEPLGPIVAHAGREALVVMGESLRHDVYRRVVGSLPIQFLGASEASLLLVKLPPEAEGELFGEAFTCHEDAD